MKGDRIGAQRNLDVGIGTLAGSTVMLLTIPWAFSLILGRCDIRGGEAVDKTLTRKCDLSKTGITVDDDTPINAKIMIGTSLSYFIVQSVAFFYLSTNELPTSFSGEGKEQKAAIAGAVVCFAALAAYCVYQLINPKLQERKIQQAKEQYMLERTVHILRSSLTRTTASVVAPAGGSESQRLLPDAKVEPDIRQVGLKWKKKAAEKAEARIDINKADEEKQNEEEEKSDEPKWKIAVKATITLAIGTGLVSFFSDPMVTVIQDFSDTIGIGAFYVAFVLTPVCSNASELISSLMFAMGKKRKNISLTYGQIYGAATMNNTLVLGIFYALIAGRGLEWNYTSETIAILAVTLAVGVIGSLKTTFATFWSIVVLTFYPAALFLVFALDNWANLK